MGTEVLQVDIGRKDTRYGKGVFEEVLAARDCEIKEIEIAPIVGGSGGGRPDMAQAGGPKPENLRQALDRLAEIV